MATDCTSPPVAAAVENSAMCSLPQVFKMPSVSESGTSAHADQAGPRGWGKDDNRTLIKKPFIGMRGPIKGPIFDKALTSLSSGPTWEVFIKC